MVFSYTIEEGLEWANRLLLVTLCKMLSSRSWVQRAMCIALLLFKRPAESVLAARAGPE